MNTKTNDKFNAKTQMNEGVCTVFLSGELDLSVAPDFRLVMEPLVGNSEVDLIVNMKDMTYIDSTGIG
ncbi:STAS domain-containing protein, partial [Mycobacterium kansasii]